MILHALFLFARQLAAEFAVEAACCRDRCQTLLSCCDALVLSRCHALVLSRENIRSLTLLLSYSLTLLLSYSLTYAIMRADCRAPSFLL